MGEGMALKQLSYHELVSLKKQIAYLPGPLKKLQCIMALTGLPAEPINAMNLTEFENLSKKVLAHLRQQVHFISPSNYGELVFPSLS